MSVFEDIHVLNAWSLWNDEIIQVFGDPGVGEVNRLL